MENIPNSCKNLWVMLSGTTILKSKDEIGKSLEKSARQLIKGITYYQEREEKDDPNEIEVLKKQCTDVPAEFILKLSIQLNVQSDQCYEIFLSYLLFEYTGSIKSIQSFFTNEKMMNSLCNEVWNFYYSERLYALFCIKQILSNWHENSIHPYQNLFSEFIYAANKDNTLIKSFISQLETSLTKTIPPKYLANSYQIDHSANDWFKATLKERFEIVQLIILFFNQIDPTIDDIIKIYKLVQNNGGAKYSFSREKYLKDHELETLISYNSAIESLLIAACMKLQDMNDADKYSHFLLKSDPKILELNQCIMESNSSLQSNSIIYLAWIIIRNNWAKHEIEQETNQQIIAELSKHCLRLEVFTYLNRLLFSEIFKSINETYAGKILKIQMAKLISQFAVFYDIEDLPDPNATKAILSLFIELLKEDEIASELLEDEDEGLTVLFRCSCLAFPLRESFLPVNLFTFLQVAKSLAQTTSCLKAIEAISQIDCFAEELEVTSPFLVPSEEDGYYVCTQTKSCLEGTVIIDRGTSARILRYDRHKGTVLVSWQGVTVNAWKVITYIYKSKIEDVSRGIHENVNEQMLDDIRFVNQICCATIETSSYLPVDLRTIVLLSLEGFKLFSRFEPFPRLFVASIVDLLTALLKVPQRFSLKAIWEILQEFNLLPYMLGLNQDLNDVIAGRDTNSSLIGQVIASDECTCCEYQLCIAFLKFVSSNIPLVEPDSQLLGCLLYIFNEILPSFSRWRYRNPDDMVLIGFYCFEIANNALSLNRDKPNGKKLVEVCVNALLTGPSGQVIFKTAQNGLQVVKEVVTSNGSATLLVTDKRLIIIRKSLSVLNQLLQLKDKLEPVKGSTTAVEKALYETSSIASNMLLTLAQYVYQPYDSRLAALSVQLLRRLAKYFPRSMLTCLGSEAEAVREHFLFKLDAVTEDVRVKVCLLDFLSACVKYQPGLIEMFINGTSQEDDEGDDETSSCLAAVTTILKEKLEEQYYCPPELHTAALRFLNTFWLQSHLPAIESLKKNPKLWTLICFPILEKEGETATSGKIQVVEKKLSSYILRLLAREVFLVKTLEKESFGEDLAEIFKKLPGRLEVISEQLASESKAEIIDENQDGYSLLVSWKDLVVSLAKFEPFAMNQDLKQTIYLNLLSGLQRQLELKASYQVTGLFADICLMIFKTWSTDLLQSATFDEWQRLSTEILYRTNEHKETLSVGFLVTIQSLTAHSVSAMEIELKNRSNDLETGMKVIQDWITPSCGLLLHSLRILENSLNQSLLGNEIRLTMASLALFKKIILASVTQAKTWLSVVRNANIIGTLAELLNKLVTSKQGLELATAIMDTFVVFSLSEETAFHLQSSKIVSIINPILADIYTSRQVCVTDGIKLSYGPELAWLKVYEIGLRLNSSLLLTLRHYYIQDALDFVSVHKDRIVSTLGHLRSWPAVSLLEETSETLRLYRLLAHYKLYWLSVDKQLYELFSNQVSINFLNKDK